MCCLQFHNLLADLEPYASPGMSECERRNLQFAVMRHSCFDCYFGVTPQCGHCLC